MRDQNQYPTIEITKPSVQSLEFQRRLERGRLKKLKNSIKMDGYWPWEPILLTPDWKVIDGQHRLTVARELGLKRIPFVIVALNEFSGQAELFKKVNDWSTRLKPLDYWHARYICQDPLAMLIYKLEMDVSSSLFEKVAIKGKDTKYKHGIPQILYALSGIIGPFFNHWKRDNDSWFIKNVAKPGFDFYHIHSPQINLFFTFMETVYGPKKENSFPYFFHIFKGICSFWGVLLVAGETRNGFSSICRKMKTFIIDPTFQKLPSPQIAALMIAHYNKKKKKQINVTVTDTEFRD